MKKNRIVTSALALIMVFMLLLAGCNKEPLPETTGEELGVYVLNNAFIDANGEEYLQDGVPVYRFDEDGNVVTAGEKKDIVVIAAPNIAYFTCINDAIVNDADTKKEIPVYVLADESEIYDTVSWEMPIMVVPDKVVNSHFTVETSDEKTIYFNDGDKLLEFDDTEDVVLKITAVYSGEAKIFVTNCLGEIVKTIDVAITAKESTDEDAVKEIEDKVAACTHEYGSEVVLSTEATEGYTQYTCKNCGHMYRADYKAKLPCTHAFTERVVKSTCAEKGYTLCTCTKCGHTEKKNFTKLAAHTFSDKIVPATCTEKGYTLHTCTICKAEVKDTYTDLIDHSYKHETVASTCSAEGYTLHTCTVCGANYKDNHTALKDHTYVISTVAPTYTAQGYTLHTCNVCGSSYKDNYTEKLACTNHNYAETSRTEASCTTAGTINKSCTICGATATESIPQTGHSYSDSVVQPTCGADGYTTHTCGVCGSSYTDTAIPALGHDWQTREEQQEIGSEEHALCGTCGCDFTATGVDVNSHIKDHALKGEGGSYYITHVPIYGTVTITTCGRCGASQ